MYLSNFLFFLFLKSSTIFSFCIFSKLEEILRHFLLGNWIFIFYFLLPTLLIFLSFLVVYFKNPIYSLFSLILIFFLMVLLLLSFRVEFLSLIFIIIYIGAIAILFLFVIMMFNLKQLEAQTIPLYFWQTLFIYSVLLPKFYFSIIYAINSYLEYNIYFIAAEQRSLDIVYFLSYKSFDILLFSNLFYTYYNCLFLLSGVILLTAMIGSIVLALSTTEET